MVPGPCRLSILYGSSSLSISRRRFTPCIWHLASGIVCMGKMQRSAKWFLSLAKTVSFPKASFHCSGETSINRSCRQAKGSDSPRILPTKVGGSCLVQNSCGHSSLRRCNAMFVFANAILETNRKFCADLSKKWAKMLVTSNTTHL